MLVAALVLLLLTLNLRLGRAGATVLVLFGVVYFAWDMENNGSFKTAVMDVDEANFEEIVRVNTWGVIVCTQEAAKQMIAQGSGGKIINTGSIASRQGFWDFVPYCVAKFGTLAVTQATARGLIEHGITVNAFAPGVVDTPMWVGLNEDIRAIHGQLDEADPMREFAGGTLIGRPAHPSELAPFLVYLASAESDYMTASVPS